MEDWRIRQHHGAERFLHSYLVYRARNETVGKYSEIHEVAKVLSVRTGNEYEKTLHALCWLALGRVNSTLRSPGPCRRLAKSHGHADHPPSLGLNLLSAAAHLGHISLARELLQDGHSPIAMDRLFDSPMFLAAFAGNVDMVKLFQQYIPDFKNDKDYDEIGDRWEGVRGALQRGDLNMFHLTAFPPTAKQPGDRNDKVSDLAEYLRGPRSRMSTRSWEMYSYVCSFLQDHPSERDLPIKVLRDLVIGCHAQYGNLEIIQGLLDEGLDCRRAGYANRIALIKAAAYAHEDMVDLLLRRGADPNYQEGSQDGSALVAAAGCGSLRIMRKLLAHGASVEDCNFYRSLKHAVLREHTAMIELLHEKGTVEQDELMCLKEVAMTEGLESMVNYLETLIPQNSKTAISKDRVVRASRAWGY
ncbi:ankyrin [Hypoxylon sp. FL1857]|nr:ankyrin [Hypoxylon sp. FL1857]